jgi:hypothetical protein
MVNIKFFSKKIYFATKAFFWYNVPQIQERMKILNLIFVGILGCGVAFGANAAPAKCSKTNLTRCLDSACAINGGVNPSARCQYCGTSSAGTPPSTKGLKNVTAGASTKYALSAKELSVAPSDPGRRYIWATTECIKKLPGCTPDDASTVYDKLIEQSCRAAGISIQVSNTIQNLNSAPSKTKCTESMTACMTKKCGASFADCQSDSDFDRFLAECATDATGCDTYTAEFRKEFSDDRERAYATREGSLDALVAQYKTTRENKITMARTACNRGTASETCVNTVCAKNMPGKCKESIEKSMATQLCKFYDTACTVLK